MQFAESAEVIEHRHNATTLGAAVLFTKKSTPDHLHIAYWAQHLAGNQQHVGLRRIEAGSQYAVVAKDADFAALKSIQEVAACGRGIFTAYIRREEGPEASSLVASRVQRYCPGYGNGFSGMQVGCLAFRQYVTCTSVGTLTRQ